MAPQFKILHGYEISSDEINSNLITKMLYSCMWTLNINYLVDTFVYANAYFFIHDGPELIAFASLDFKKYILPASLYDSWDGESKLVHNKGLFDKSCVLETSVGHVAAITSSKSGYGALLMKEIMSYVYRSDVKYIVIEALKPLHETYYPKHKFQYTTLLGSYDRALVPMIRKLIVDDVRPVWWANEGARSVYKRTPLQIDAAITTFSERTTILLTTFLTEKKDSLALVLFHRFWCRYHRVCTDNGVCVQRSHAERIFSMRNKIVKNYSSLEVPVDLPVAKSLPWISQWNSQNKSCVLLKLDNTYDLCSSAASMAIESMLNNDKQATATKIDSELFTHIDMKVLTDDASNFSSEFSALMTTHIKKRRTLILYSAAIAYLNENGHREDCNEDYCTCRDFRISHLIADNSDGPLAASAFKELLKKYDICSFLQTIITPTPCSRASAAPAALVTPVALAQGPVVPVKKVSGKRRRSIDDSNIVGAHNVPALPKSDGRVYSALAQAWNLLRDSDIIEPVKRTSQSKIYLSKLMSDMCGSKPGCFGRPPMGSCGRGGGAHRSIESKLTYLRDGLKKAAENGVSASDIMFRITQETWGPKRHPLFMAKCPKSLDD